MQLQVLFCILFVLSGLNLKAVELTKAEVDTVVGYGIIFIGQEKLWAGVFQLSQEYRITPSQKESFLEHIKSSLANEQMEEQQAMAEEIARKYGLEPFDLLTPARWTARDLDQFLPSLSKYVETHFINSFEELDAFHRKHYQERLEIISKIIKSKVEAEVKNLQPKINIQL